MPKNIDYIRIDSDSKYYSTSEQIKLKSIKWFADAAIPSVITGSNSASGFFSTRETLKEVTTSGQTYLTSSVVIDSSGNERKILAGSNDYLSSFTLDSYKHGVEITQEKHWTAGLVKISAGTAGHLYDLNRFGITNASIILEENYYTELAVFDPIEFIETGGTYDSTGRYPLFIKSDFNQPEKLLLDGVIEPFALRMSISNFSPNVPFEPRSFKGQFGNGNTNWRISTDQVTSINYRKISKNKAWYLDDYGSIDFESSQSTKTLGNASIIGYINPEENLLYPFSDDILKPRGVQISENYDTQLSDAILKLPPGGTTYITSDEVSSACGYTYDNCIQGTDSITYGGLLY